MKISGGVAAGDDSISLSKKSKWRRQRHGGGVEINQGEAAKSAAARNGGRKKAKIEEALEGVISKTEAK
jgi:hypothetical protein